MHRIEQSLTRHAGRTALVTATGKVSYAELAHTVARWVDRLVTLNARRVAYQLDNGLDFAALNLALLEARLVGIPVPTFFSERQRSAVLASSGADLFFGAEAPDSVWAPTSFPGVYRNPLAVPGPLPEATALVTYTSGTTGEPKGVCLSAGMLIDTAASVCATLEPAGIERHMSVLPLSLLLENVAGLFANLLNGGITVLRPLADIGLAGSSGIDLERFVAAQNESRPESLILVPQLLLALTAAAEFGMALPDSYRFVAVGGGRVPVSLLNRAREVGIPAYEGYGLTECGSVVAMNVPGADRPGSVGRPLPHVRLAVADDEILVETPGMLGYAGVESSEPMPIATGDLGALDDDGFLHVKGRRKNSYISAFGRNINPEWIESELAVELAVGSAAVFGDAEPVNVALIVPRAGFDSVAVAAAVAHCNERLPDYARVSAWNLVTDAALRQHGCVTDNGRLRRQLIEGHFGEDIQQLFEREKEYS